MRILKSTEKIVIVKMGIQLACGGFDQPFLSLLVFCQKFFAPHQIDLIYVNITFIIQ